MNFQNLKHPPFNLKKLITTSFQPKAGEKLCILIDLQYPTDLINLAFLKKKNHDIQRIAYDIFYEGLQQGTMQQLGLAACDLFAYKITGGSNLELPEKAIRLDGKEVFFHSDIYSNYQIVLCISTYSATAPLTAAAKKFGFRGGTMHGLNDVILRTGLAVDYNVISREAEVLRQGMTNADWVEVDFSVNHHTYHLHIVLAHQEAQKSHGLCRKGFDIVNLPAGEVYFVPVDAWGEFPIKFEEDGSLGVMKVANGKIQTVSLLRGNASIIDKYQSKFIADPATAIIGELGFGTQLLPFSGADIQDEKIFGTFHLAIGRNDHLGGQVTKDRFVKLSNATHDDILFSKNKTPEISVDQLRIFLDGKISILIERNEPTKYFWGLR